MKNDKERKSLKLYNQALTVFEGVLGKNATYSDDLERVGKFVFGKKFNGIYSSDDVIPKTNYSIVNTDVRGLPGTHWLSVANDLLYDSFGRKTSTLLANQDLINRTMTDDDAEQTKTQENCGARCLAWLFVYHTLGHDYASLI